MKRALHYSQWVFTVMIVFLALSCGDDGDEMEEMEEEEEQEFVLEGAFKGTWSSNPPNVTYTDLGISVLLGEGTTPNSIVGDFFFTDNFISCCNNGGNDGSLSMVVVDNVITDFVYDSLIPDCNGNFTGEGEIDDSGALRITFTGRDCDGFHADGVIILRK